LNEHTNQGEQMRKRLFLWLGSVGVTIAALLYFFPTPPKLGPLPELNPTAGRLLVIAPHSDDESLATGGILQQAQAAGGRPHVILVTGGDGFRLAAEAHFRRPGLSGREMIAFGRYRLTESQAALRRLGLGPDQLSFLGYPDHEMHQLWLDCWRAEKPCTSPQTHVAAVPYLEALRPGRPYAGSALVADLVARLIEIRPSIIAYPHPNEAHVDHWAISNFVTAALEQVRRTDPTWAPPQEWLYLVHRGDWPAPKGYLPSAPLLPPAKLAAGMTTWYAAPLTAPQIQVKRAAVAAYPSQVAILRRFMHSFIRQNELFGTLAPVNLAAASSGPIPVVPPWGGLRWTRVTTDPGGDTVARKVERSADLRALWAASDGRMLYMGAELAGPLLRPATVSAYVRGYRPAFGWGDLARVTLLRAARAGGALSTDGTAGTGGAGRWAWARVPLAALGSPVSVMLGSETHVTGALIDRTAWRLLSLDGR
jgi:LmbE family N-acetylglucosaminyl deacetylase